METTLQPALELRARQWWTCPWDCSVEEELHQGCARDSQVNPVRGARTGQQQQGTGDGWCTLCAAEVHGRGGCMGEEQPVVLVGELWGCYGRKCRCVWSWGLVVRILRLCLLTGWLDNSFHFIQGNCWGLTDGPEGLTWGRWSLCILELGCY